LLDALLPPFEGRSGYRIKIIAVGSGQALELGRRGEADILIVHDPVGEREFVDQGFGSGRVPLMRNEFVIVGPPDDPAAIEGAGAVEAVRAVAAREALFVSRADRSGTHTKERALWRQAGVTPDGRWYRESGQGMSATLQIANELGAYALTDIGTLLSHRYPLRLEILVEDDPMLDNPYHIVLPSVERFPWLNRGGAEDLRDYLVSPAAQRAIAAFGRVPGGRSLFVPARERSKRVEGGRARTRG
jgi:tungstate transport system substrate-binding protein